MVVSCDWVEVKGQSSPNTKVFDFSNASEPRQAFSDRERSHIASKSDTSGTGRHDSASTEPKSKITKNNSTNSIYELPTAPNPPGARSKMRPPVPPLPPSRPDQPPLPNIPPKTGQREEAPLAIMNPSFQPYLLEMPIKPERKQMKSNFGKFYKE